MSMLHLGLMHFKPISPFQKDFKRAQQYFKEAADEGNMDAQYHLAYMYEYGHVEENLDLAIKYHEMAASKGHIWSYTSLTRLYQIRTPPNYHRAFSCCLYAAEHGNPQAEFNLGILYLVGRGCDYDNNKAKHWLRRAESHGFLNAKIVLDTFNEPNGFMTRPGWLPKF